VSSKEESLLFQIWTEQRSQPGPGCSHGHPGDGDSQRRH